MLRKHAGYDVLTEAHQILFVVSRRCSDFMPIYRSLFANFPVLASAVFMAPLVLSYPLRCRAAAVFCLSVEYELMYLTA